MERSNLRNIISLRNLYYLLILAPVFALAASFTDSVLIGGKGPANSKAELEVKSTTKGVLLPRMTTTQQNAITSPTEGLIIYDNVLHQLSIYDGAIWQSIFDAGNLTGTIPPGTVPTATTGAIGLVFAKNATSHNFITGITSGTGAITTAQPAFTDISGNIAVSQMNSGTSASSTTFWRGDGTWATGASVPLTTLGDTLYEDATPTPVRLAGNTTTTRKYLAQTGTGTISAAPSWLQPGFGDLSGTAGVAQGGTGSDYSGATGVLQFNGVGGSSVGDVITVPQGGTGIESYVVGDMLYANSTSTLAQFNGNTTTTKKFLTQTGTGTVSAAPTWAALVGADLPNPSSSTLGGVKSLAAVSHNFLTSISTGGVPTQAQPAFTDISGVATIAQGGTNNGSLAVTAGGTLYTDGSAIQNVGAGTSGQVLKSNGASAPTWGNAQGGLISDREMITNTDIEVNSTGYTAYADAAGTTPVDCTGGSPNSTIARSTTTPITGTGELLWTKSGGANRQGEGFSIPFTIGTADQAKVIQLDIDSIIRSGTFVAGSSGSSGVDSDLEYYIYDVTNSTLIQPTTYKIFSNNASGSYHTTTNFQTSSSGTSYRLCVHTATTSTANYTVGFDNISIHPSRYTYGTPITDWTAYTPTFVGLGTASGVNIEWRHVGSSMEIRGNFTTGTATATTASMTLPNGLVAGGGVTTLTVCGRGNQDNTTSPTTKNFVALCTQNSNLVQFSLDGAATTTSPLAASNGSTVWFNTTKQSFQQFSVPIQGWSSTIQMSDGAPQSQVGLRAHASTGASMGTLTNSFTVTKFDTVDSDTNGAYNATTGIYTVPVPGYYDFSAQIITTGTAALNTNLAMDLFNVTTSTEITQSDIVSGGAQTTIVVPLNVKSVFLTAGTQVEIRSIFTGTYTSGAYANGTTLDFFTISRQASPTSIGATETVAASYQETLGMAIPTGAFTVVNFDTLVDDSWGAVTTGASWQFKVPSPGRYEINAGVTFASASWTNTHNIQMRVYKNGVANQYLALLQAPITGTLILPTLSGSAVLKLNAGDLIDIRVFQNEGSNKSLSTTQSHVDIYRIGL